MGVALTVIGFLLSVAGLLLRGLAAHRAPWGNMFEFTVTAMIFIVGAYLIMVWRAGVRWLGLPVTLLAAVGNGLAVTVFYVAVAPLVPALHSVWFLIHIVAAAISGAAFNVGGVMSILYLIKKRAEDRDGVTGYLERLPSSRKIDLIAYRFLAFAFPLWTFTVVAGSIWAEYAWGRYLGLGSEGNLGSGHLGDLRGLSARPCDGRLARHQSGCDRDHRHGLVLVQLHRYQFAGLRPALLRRRLRPTAA